MIDMVVHRHHLHETLGRILRLLAERPAMRAPAAKKKANGADTDSPLALPSPGAEPVPSDNGGAHP